MALRGGEFTPRTIQLEVSFSYEDQSHQRCMLAYLSYRSGGIRFGPSRVDIRRAGQANVRGLTQQETDLVAGVRRAQTNNYAPTEIIRLAPNYAIFGPYRLKGIADRNLAILKAIRDSYLEYDKLYLIFKDNWPKTQLHEIKSRLSATDCADYIVGFRG